MSEAGTDWGNAYALLDAVLSISSDLDPQVAARRIVEASCDMTGARYGFLAVLGEHGEMIEYVVHGLTDDEVKELGDPPTVLGALAGLMTDLQALRLTNLAEHAAGYGITDIQPPMTTFLGMPLRVGESVFGHLYLTEKQDGREFDERDEALVESLAKLAGLVIHNARAYALSERRREWVEATAQIAESLHPGVQLEEPLAQIAIGARRVAKATLVAVVQGGEQGYEVPAADGTHYAILPGMLEALGTEFAAAQSSGQMIVSPHEEGGTIVLVPLRAQFADPGVLLVVLDHGRGSLPADDRDLLASFATQAGLTLDRARALVERQEVMLVADRDRIARDLHDLVIQRLFATGLGLQGAARVATSRDVRHRLHSAVSDLDGTIRDIRSTIFELQHGHQDSLRTGVGSLVREYAPALGFTPLVRTAGPLDSLVSQRLGESMLAVLREALANCARHAQATSALVELEVDPEWLVLRLTDDGRGMSSEIQESGLGNMRHRAEELGGSMTLSPAQPSGTQFEWRVPHGA